MSRRREKDGHWVTKDLAAKACSLGVRQFHDAIVPRLPANASDGAGGELRFHMPTVIQTYVWYRLEEQAGRTWRPRRRTGTGPRAIP